MVIVSWVLTPTPQKERLGDQNQPSTLLPYSAKAPPRLIVVVVFPTPPFWLHNAIMRAGPWDARAGGSGNSRTTRPVGPRFSSDFAMSRVYRRGLSGAGMSTLVDVTQRVNGDFCVNLCRGNRGMPQQLLHHPNIRSAVQDVGSKRMSECVRRN
jgi:hypothetical protein